MTRFSVCLVAVTVMCGCADAAFPDDELQIAFVGQSLSRHDPRDFLEAPAGTVAPHLLAADVAFTNLEVSIDGAYCPCPPTKQGNSLQVADPPVVEFLAGLNFGLLSLANNHSWNYSGDGVRSTIQAARDNRLTHAGTGETLADAVGAGVRQIRGHKVGLIASATVKLGADAMAGDGQPGINLLRVGNDADWTRNLESIRAASDTTDILIVYQHFQVEDVDVAAGNPFGHEEVSDLVGWQRDWAHAAIDAGASVYVAHGAREFRGVEVYRDRPIFYGLGNFIFHSGQPVGYYAPDVWESVIATVTFDGGLPREVDFVPIVLDEGTPGPDFLQSRGVPEVAEGRLAEDIISRLATLSAEWGTQLVVDQGRARLTLNRN